LDIFSAANSMLRRRPNLFHSLFAWVRLSAKAENKAASPCLPSTEDAEGNRSFPMQVNRCSGLVIRPSFVSLARRTCYVVL
jgi:hypothetical protein